MRGLFHLLDVRGRRRAREAIRRALPELDAGEQHRLARDSDRAAAERRRAERAARGVGAVELCGRLRWVGWEGLHELAMPALFLLPPLGSPALARRALEAFHPETSAGQIVAWDAAADLEPTAHGALQDGAAAVLVYALPEKHRRFAVHLETPVRPSTEDDAAALVRRWRAAFAAAVRRHPRHGWWRDPGWGERWLSSSLSSPNPCHPSRHGAQ